MNKRVFLFFVIQFIVLGTVFSQQLTTEPFQSDIFNYIQQKSDTTGIVSIHQNDQINQLVLEHLEIMKKQAGIPGYRINIFFDSGKQAKQKAYAQQDSFAVHFPNIPVEIVYNSPYYKVYVGYFRSKSEAFTILKTINRRYPNAFIVNDIIKLYRFD